MSNNKLYVDINTIKQHLNIICDYTADDILLGTYLEIAQDVCANKIDCSLESLEDENGSLPSGLIGAILLYVGELWENREAVERGNPIELPLGLRYILDCYRNYNPSNKTPNNINKCCNK